MAVKSRYWSVSAQTVVAGTPLVGEWVDCAEVAALSIFYQYTQATSGPTIAIQGSFDGGATAVTLKSLTPGTGSPVTANLAWVGTATALGSSTVTEAPASPAPMVRITVTAAALNNVTAGSFAVMAGSR